MKSTDNMTFEEAIAKLEDTVMHLEAGSLSLDDSLSEFEAAVKLVTDKDPDLALPEHAVLRTQIEKLAARIFL